MRALSITAVFRTFHVYITVFFKFLFSELRLQRRRLLERYCGAGYSWFGHTYVWQLFVTKNPGYV